eukprot:2896251-Prymnesium_polylepis.1
MSATLINREEHTGPVHPTPHRNAAHALIHATVTYIHATWPEVRTNTKSTRVYSRCPTYRPFPVSYPRTRGLCALQGAPSRSACRA